MYWTSVTNWTALQSTFTIDPATLQQHFSGANTHPPQSTKCSPNLKKSVFFLSEYEACKDFDDVRHVFSL
jgi:hypothetical protein